MSTLSLEIIDIKNISHGKLEIPIDNGIYCLVGKNGCGKSTIMSCLAQTIFSSSLNMLREEDYSQNSFVKLKYDEKETIWFYDKNKGSWKSNVHPTKRIHFNGLYEGSLFYGTRFRDSLIVDDLVHQGVLSIESIVDADEYIKNKMSYILHGNAGHYQKLMRVRNKRIAADANLTNTPYFQMFKDKMVSQYRMSSGECMLISLLHFIYNSLERRSLSVNRPVLMLIDEIELALHPVAISRLVSLLEELVEKYNNLTVVLTTHSPDVIRKISPHNLYMVETNDSPCTESFIITNPCYPSYAIRDIYMHDGFDYVILVEDNLAKHIVSKIIKENRLNDSCLINVLPIGGWENVLKFQHEVYRSNSFGVGTRIFSVLDGDIQGKVGKEYKQFTKLYLPIGSVEKLLLKVVTEPNSKPYYRKLKKDINDNFFEIDTIDAILENEQYHCEGDNNGKALYSKLRQNYQKRGISEDTFVKELCEILLKYLSFGDFISSLKKIILKK